MVKRFKKKYNKIQPLDLHGFKHADVPQLVEDYLFKYQEECPLKIITGNSNRMKQIVINIIKSHGFNYLDGDFYNRGYISVLN
jgi:hypothetical protein